MAAAALNDNVLTRLTERISEVTGSISQYLLDNDLPFPSFEANAPELPKVLESKCLDVFEATRQLGELMLGARESFILKARYRATSLHAISSFKLAHLVPTGGEISYSELASSSGLSEINVRRIMRYAMTDRIFKETRKGFVSHTAASRMIAEDSNVADYLDVTFNEVHPATYQTVNALKKWPDSQELAHSGFSLSTSGETLFSYLNNRPERARAFAGGMSIFSSGSGWEMDHVLHGFDWTSIGDGKVVDVGGSTGEVMAILSQHYPHLHCVVQDLSSTIDKRPVLPPYLDSHIEFMAHDFFTEQPVTGADVYFFRMIMHDWSDADAVRILQQLIPALKAGAHVLVNEFCLPEPNTAPWLEEKNLRTMDIDMLSLFNSRERDEDDWRYLFSQADKRFVMKGIDKPSGSSLSFVHFIWEPQ
ncbi:MAG: hypothetical protein Q9160_008547 [Pyrenula sp. 1 TL-2023]